MEKAFAYICTAADTAPRLLKRYCRKVYELGYVPICPKLNDGQYLAMDNADEKRDFHNIARQKLVPDAGGLRQGDQQLHVRRNWNGRKEEHHLHHTGWSGQNQGSWRGQCHLTCGAGRFFPSR